MVTNNVQSETPPVTVTHGQGHPDPRALAVAQALQERLPDTQVVLFGSRATGTWHPWSDLDLAVIGAARNREVEFHLQDTATTIAQGLYEAPPSVQVFPFPRVEFEEFRTSLPHIAGQVQRRGLTPSGEHLPPMPQDNPWPGIQIRLQSTRRHLEQALRGFGHESLDAAVFSAHAALENGIKAALSAVGVDFPNTHKLVELTSRMPDTHHPWLEGMMSDVQLAELSSYREQVQYSGEDIPWPTYSAEAILRNVQQVCGNLASHVLSEMGKSPRDVGYAKWMGDGSLAGWESLPLDYFSQAEVEERRLAGRSARILRGLMGNVLEPEALDRIESAWRAKGLPVELERALERVAKSPDEWRILLPDEPADETDPDSTDSEPHKPPGSL